MIYDYLTSIEVSVQTCENTFAQNIVPLGRYFETASESEYEILNTVMKIHEFFATASSKERVEKGLCSKWSKFLKLKRIFHM